MQKCALVVGHKKNSPGAVNGNANLTEFEFNDALTVAIEKQVQGVEVQRIYRRTYESLPDDINAYAPDFIISLHCNAFNQAVSGTEVLYYHKSSAGRDLAETLQKELLLALKLNDRGTKPKSVEERGGYLLKSTQAPCVIAEPFFIDNDDDLEQALSCYDNLVSAYVKSIQATAGLDTDTPGPVFTLNSNIAFQARDAAQAFKFYSEVLGFTPLSGEEGALSSGGFTIFVDAAPVTDGTLLELNVGDVEVARTYLESKGCEVVRWDGAGSACVVRDPFGIAFNLWQTS